MMPLGLTDEALAAAGAEPDPESLAASVRLRGRFGPVLAAAAVTQVMLRRRARTKFGGAAATMFLTRDGLEQATRPEVAGYRAQRLAAAGATRVVDLGCGIGTDALAFARAGLEVVAVERDPVTADVARANLEGWAEVVVGTAEDLWPQLARSIESPRTAVFLDPARRTSRGRSWRIEDLSPTWSFVLGLLARDQPTVVKLGPGLAHRHLPAGPEAEWISHRGDTVELMLWSGSGAEPGRRSAYVVDSDDRLAATATPVPRPGPVAEVVYEPLGAVTRAGALGALAELLGAVPLAPGSSYLTGPSGSATPFAVAHRLRDRFPYREQDLRRWLKEHAVGTVEIRTRGLDLDPAALRRRLKPAGPGTASLIITRTEEGKEVLVVDETPDRNRSEK